MDSYIAPLTSQQVLKVSDRATFLYLDHCTLSRDGGALTAYSEEGTAHVPVAGLCALLVGPGTRISHQAIAAIADSGCSLVWVGEEGVRFYAAGIGLSSTDVLVRAQAEKVSNRNKRLAVVRAMYQMRFPHEDLSGLNLQQMRGKEGTRMRALYRSLAKEYKIEWSGRSYNWQNFAEGTPQNQALSAASAALYGLTYAVICALGASPALGFIHSGNARSFVFDIADLYKAETSIPIAFEIAAAYPNASSNEISSLSRHAMRDRFQQLKLAERMAQDIKTLLLTDTTPLPQNDAQNSPNTLWDDKGGTVAGGLNYQER